MRARLGEQRVRRKDGTLAPVPAAITPALSTFGGRAVIEMREAGAARQMSEAGFRALIQNAADILAIVGLDGRVRYVSPAVETVLGYTPDELDGIGVLTLFHPEDAERARSVSSARLAGAALPDASRVYRLRRRDGSWRHLEVVTTNLLEDPNVRGIVLNIRDVTARIEAEERFQLVARATNDAIWDWDLRTDALWWNDSITAVFGYPSEQVGHDGDWWKDRIHPADRERVVAGIHATVHGGGREWSDEYQFRRADGAYAVVADRGSVLRDEAGAPIRMIGGMKDVTDRARLEENLRRLAFYDPLTGLPNRTSFLDRLREALRSGAEGNAHLAVLVLDIDGFKLVNDSLGHPAGDVLLAAAGERLSSQMPAQATLARLGGDEFAVLLPGVSDITTATRIGERLRHALRAPFTVSGRNLFATMSIGVVVVRDAASGRHRPLPGEGCRKGSDDPLRSGIAGAGPRPARGGDGPTLGVRTR
jgi:diguanylate cyclase (GGDEF)-like protein/PAS domain S-box-containing protein